MLELKHIYKKYQDRIILDDVSLKFPDRGLVGIKGESGCGKSTFLYLLGMLDQEYEGEILYQGECINDNVLFIREHMAFMMQNNDLISALTVKENILLPSQIAQKSYSQKELQEIVKRLDIEDYLYRYPDMLSGGQKKRVSLAKALLKKANILLCDEPTGALHQKQADEVMRLLKEVSQECLVIVVSHDQELLKRYADSLLTIEKGKIKGRIKSQPSLSTPSFSSHHYSLWFYPIRQCLFQKNKFSALCLFQWMIIVSFFLIVTFFQGFQSAIAQSEKTSVAVNQITIENKDGLPFQNLIDNHWEHVQYQYHLENLLVQDLDAQVSVLPYQTSHIVLQKGHLPTKENEILVSYPFNKYYQQMLTLTCDETNYSFQVVGVLEKDFFQSSMLYIHPSFFNQIETLKDDYILLVEAKMGENQKTYQELEKNYFAYNETIERIASYQSVYQLATHIAYLFIGMSFFISLLLIGIVESMIYASRKRDIAYLISLGLKRGQLYLISLGEALFLALVMTIGGCMLSYLVYIYVNHVFHLYQKYGLSLVLKPIFLTQYDLFVLIAVVYIVMVILGTMMPVYKASRTNVIEMLREE